MKTNKYNYPMTFRTVLLSTGLTLLALVATNSIVKAQFGASPWTAPSGTFTVPAGVTSITVFATGGGGAGGSGKSFQACNSYLGGAGGGGGGGFSTNTLTVTSGQTITVVSGTGGAPGAAGNNPGGAGGASSVTYSGGGSVSAGGGGGGGAFAGGSSTTPGTAGAAGVGTTHNGGQGGAGNYQYLGYDAGGGGGGAGSSSNGSAGNNTNGGGAGGTGTYPGGAGATGSGSYDTNGNAGAAPGGGGAGELAWCSNKQGGAGGAGRVVITYTVPVFSISSISPSSGCPGSTITINGVNLSAATAITIGGVAVASITSNTATQIIAVVGSSGTGAVAVTNSNGTTSSPTNFTVITTLAQPSAITGGPGVCANSTNTFSVPAVAGATSYTWTLPGTWSGTSTTNSISALSDANGGTISVIANNACFSSASQSTTISINLAPSMPGTISGNSTVCEASLQSYSIGSVSNATTYSWSFPGGWSGTASSTSLSVTAGNTGGTISVTANNACGNSAAQTLSVVANPLPSQPASIIGNTSICAGTTQTYYVNAAANASSYTWTIPGTWTGTSTTDSITVITANTGGTMSIVSNNGCGSSAVKTQSITTTVIPATPAAISGSSTLCSSTVSTYSVTAVSGATSYTWTLPSGWSGSSSTNTITTTSSTTGGTVFVTANNACGSSSAQSVSVTVSSSATTPSVIYGPNTVCGGNASYTVLSDPNATSYTWTLPGGWSGTSTTDSIYAIVGTNQGTVTVVVNSNCGSSNPQTLNVSLGIPPAQPSSMLGVTHLCDSSSTAYAVTNDPNATGYTWTLPSGWSGTSNTNSITATASTTSGVISVTADNACGSSAPSTLNVIGNTIPVVTVASFGRVCDNLSPFALSGGSPAGGTYSGTGVNSNTFDPSVSGDGTYFVTYTYANGACVRSDSAAITVDNCTGINSNTTNNNISIYPNPFTSESTISFSSEQKHITIKIVDVVGKEIKTINFNGKQCVIEKGTMQSGIYFVQISDENKNIVNRKIVVE